MLNEILSNVAAALVAGTVLASAAVYAEGAPAPDTAPIVSTQEHNGFACVRPSFAEVWTTDNGTPHWEKRFAGYRLCHEQLPVDKDGYLVFPEA